MQKGKVKRKINKKGLLVLVLILYVIIMSFYYVFTLPVKYISIRGNNLVSDEEITKATNIDAKTAIFKLNKNKIIKNIQKISLISSVKMHKHLNGTLTIVVEEQNILFYNTQNNTYVLWDKQEVSDVSSALGVPTLINYVPKETYENLLQKLQKIDADTLKLVSEIEYSPNIKDNVTIDGNRFLLRMNDGNYVYINLANFTNLNRYQELYATLDDSVKGILNLDSSSENGVLFQSFTSLEKKGEVNEN